MAHTVETERTRCSTEAALADRLFHVQSKIVGFVNDMEGIQFRFVHGFRLHERICIYNRYRARVGVCACTYERV